MENVETERKFLVKDSSYRSLCTQKLHICQGYLNDDPERSVRVRVKAEKGYITIKSLPDESGWSRYEFEFEIDLKQAEQLLKLCLPTPIIKTRYIVPYDNYTVEIDEFEGENSGLVVAEIELDDVKQEISIPEFIGKEVTGDNRYFNLYLSQHPYKEWKNENN